MVIFQFAMLVITRGYLERGIIFPMPNGEVPWVIHGRAETLLVDCVGAVAEAIPYSAWPT